MPIAPTFTSIYEQRFIVDYFDCDTEGNLNIVDFCKLIQIASAQHSVLGGISFWDLQTVNQAWVVNKFRVEITRVPKWQEEIRVVTWIEKLDGIRSVRNFEVFIEDEKVAGASSLWVILNTVRRRPEMMTLPHDHFIKYTDKKSIDGEFVKYGKPEALDKLVDSQVQYSDLDMVNHVTNIKYLEWIVDAVKMNDIHINSIKVVDMVFQKELRFKEEYSVFKSKEGNSNHYMIKNKEDQISFQCIIE